MNIFERIFGMSNENLLTIKAQIREEMEEEAHQRTLTEVREAKQVVEQKEAKEKAEQKALDNYKEDKMTSDEPWVEMVGHSVDPERGIKVELAWNPAFIKYLREGGIQGTSEEECAQRWLAMVAQDVDSRVGDHDNDGKDDSEFE